MQATMSNAARGVLLLLGLLVAARLAAMGLLPLMDSTEARYAEIGRKMVEGGDWVTPWADDGVPFWGKPPLSFWLTAASFKLFGINEFAARLPHFLCAVAIAVLTWRLGAGRSQQQALLAVASLGGSVLFYVSSGAVMTDAALVLGTTLAMVGFWVGLHGPRAPRQRERWWLFAGLAVALLAKGPVALVLIGVPLLAWTLVRGEAGAVWRAFPWIPGLLWVGVLVLPWYLVAESRTPGFLRYFIVGEHWQRFMTPGWKGDLYGTAHRFAPGTIWAFAFAALLPWSLLLPAAELVRRLKRQPPGAEAPDRAWPLYLLLWGLTPLLFFTAARNIIWTYVLPGVPTLALLGAHWLARYPARTRQRLVLGGLLLSLMGSAAFAIQFQASSQAGLRSAKALVAAYEQRRVASEPLIYVGPRPFSAAFYSGGRARRVDSVAQLAGQLPPEGAYVALRGEQAVDLKALPSLRIDTIGRFGRHDLLRLAPAAPAPPLADDEPALPATPARRPMDVHDGIR